MGLNKHGEAELLEVFGARMHNLKNVDVTLPRNQLVVITGLSGSGKSSLAFDTIYAEGQRRYLESFSAYARQFIGNLERPDVDKINGLSPVISIEQKTVSKNPRSTVGTITEVYDFFRLLFARAAEAYSYQTGKKMVRWNEEQIISRILKDFDNQKLLVLAPLIRGRKGHYRELFEMLRKQGLSKVRVNGKMVDISARMQLDRYKTHYIEVLIDRITPGKDSETRVKEAIRQALKSGKGTLLIGQPDQEEVRHFSRFLMDPDTGLSYDEPQPNTFSFNSPSGACPVCDGMGLVSEVDEDLLIPDPTKSIVGGGLAPIGEYKNNYTFLQLKELAKKYNFSLNESLGKLKPEQIHILLYGSEEAIKVPYTYASGYTQNHMAKWEGVVPLITRHFHEKGNESILQWAEEFITMNVCPECKGGRLKKESLWYKIDGQNIAELAAMNIGKLAEWLENLEERLTERQIKIGKELLKEIKSRVAFLRNVGLDYLTLNSPAKTLSGGEGQRIRLATQIGSQLTGVTYILDEPSIGLHQRDNRKLINSLKDLRDVGNTVLVVEHDKEMILESDFVVDIGPGAGKHGGRIISIGTVAEFMKQPGQTADYLSGRKMLEIPDERRKGNGKHFLVKGCTGHNLKNVNLDIPLGTLVCVTGVSGSGKSSLINETLYPILRNHFYDAGRKPLPYQSVKGLELLDKVIEIDQSPIGRTPRSNPVTYVEVFADIRNLFAALPESKIRGYKPGRFSFNVKGGRCETCQGGGMRLIEMNFLPDVYVPCESCQSKRYNRETLEVRYKGKSISDVLDMSVEQAVDFFQAVPSIYRKIHTLHEVGLGYLTLGQPSTTLSGGEAQRVKLATELSKRDTGKTIYILDEPTTGLHFEDIRALMAVLQKLVDRGNTVLVIEHNLDVIKMADYIIDLGPEGGSGGGEIIAFGTPEEVAVFLGSHTGLFLAEELGLNKKEKLKIQKSRKKKLEK